jgi:hypothetical protein
LSITWELKDGFIETLSDHLKHINNKLSIKSSKQNQKVIKGLFSSTCKISNIKSLLFEGKLIHDRHKTNISDR